jgi:hypothetical protein
MNRGSFYIGVIFVGVVFAIFLFPGIAAFAEGEKPLDQYLTQYNWTGPEIAAYDASLKKIQIPEFTKKEAELVAMVLNLIHGNTTDVKPDELALFSREALEGYSRMKNWGIKDSLCVQYVMKCALVFMKEILRWRVEGDALPELMRGSLDQEFRVSLLMDSAETQEQRLKTSYGSKPVFQPAGVN